MTLPRLQALNDYWRDHPPLHILLGSFLGVKPAAKIKEEKEENLDKLIADLSMAGLKVN
jgi:hypothetical protein